jgi:hypothetical protein
MRSCQLQTPIGSSRPFVNFCTRECDAMDTIFDAEGTFVFLEKGSSSKRTEF